MVFGWIAGGIQNVLSFSTSSNVIQSPQLTYIRGTRLFIGAVCYSTLITLTTFVATIKYCFTFIYTLNCCNDVNEGKTDWFKFKCKAARRSVESDILLDIPFLESPICCVALLLVPDDGSSEAVADMNGGDEQLELDMGEFKWWQCWEWERWPGILSWGGREEGCIPNAGLLAPELLGVDDGLLKTAWSRGCEIIGLVWCWSEPCMRMGLLVLWLPGWNGLADNDLDGPVSPWEWQWQWTWIGIGRWNELRVCSAPNDLGCPASIWNASCSSLSSSSFSFSFRVSSSTVLSICLMASISSLVLGWGVVDVVDALELGFSPSTFAIFNVCDERWQKGWCRLLRRANSSSITASSSPLASPLAVSGANDSPSLSNVDSVISAITVDAGADEECGKDTSTAWGGFSILVGISVPSCP